MKISIWAYSFLFTGVLLFSVLHPVAAQTADYYRRQEQERHDQWRRDSDEADQKRRNDDYDREFWERRRQQQQQPVPSAREIAKTCSDFMSQKLYKAQTYNLSGVISAYCTAFSRGDLNTAWIKVKRIAAIYVAKKYFSEADAEKYLDIIATDFINNQGWTPPEYK